jgi:hypothetical protein
VTGPYIRAAVFVLTAAFAFAQPDGVVVGGVVVRSGKPATPAGPAPRLPDGKPDLGNSSGSWVPRAIHDIAGMGGDPAQKTVMVEKPVEVSFQPWAKAVYEERLANLWREDPEGQCLPPGVPRMMTTPFPFQIYQLPNRILFIFEGGAHMWRIVYTDGREHPKEPNPSYLGHSIGHWEDDTLVVDAVGFNDRTWIDAAGHPHSEALHVIERFTRTDSRTLHYQVTIDDPMTYTKPWTTSYTVSFEPGWQPYEYICQENDRDRDHLVGK